jgi:hypothetical protein
MVYFHKDSSVVAVKLKARDSFRTAVMLSFYILQNITWTKVAYLSTIYCHASFQDPILSGASVALTLQVRASTIPSLPPKS